MIWNRNKTVCEEFLAQYNSAVIVLFYVFYYYNIKQ